MEDYYKILGIEKSATPADIKKAYRKLAVKYHPDKTKGDKTSEEKFKQISEAYAVLSNKEKRQQYDTYGSEGFHQRYSQEDIFRNVDINDILREFGINFGGGGGSFSFRSGSAGGSPFSFFQQSGGMGGGCADGSCGSQGFHSFHQPRQQPVKGNDATLELPITMEEVLSGSEKTISMGRGAGAEKVSVKIPAGIETGKKLRVKGKGSPSPMGGPAGDLYLLIKVLPHSIFIREDDDLIVDKKISISEILLGAKIDVPTIEGKKLSVTVPAGTQPQARLRLKGKGLPSGPRGPRGDLFVRIGVEVPKKLSKAQEQLVKELQKAGL